MHEWTRQRNWSGERLFGDWVFEEPARMRAEPVNDSPLVVGENHKVLSAVAVVSIPIRCGLEATGQERPFGGSVGNLNEFSYRSLIMLYLSYDL